MRLEEAKNELSALFRKNISRDINDVNKTWGKKIKSTSEAHLRNKEENLQKRRTSNEINTAESSKHIFMDTNQQIVGPTK